MEIKMQELSWKSQILYVMLLFKKVDGELRYTEAPKTILEQIHMPTPELEGLDTLLAHLQPECPKERLYPTTTKNSLNINLTLKAGTEPVPKSIVPQDVLVNGTEIPDPFLEAPDYRIEEDAWLGHTTTYYIEENRPIRFSPFYKQLLRWDASKWYTQKATATYVGCYCTTVYKRLTMLAGCAVLTMRHILTTATATELVLKHHRNRETLQDILGAWYDHNGNTFNSSLYMTPSRIHYHPDYLHPHQVNITHPLPFRFDLAVFTSTNRFYGYLLGLTQTVLCARGAPHWYQYLSSTPRTGDLALVVGFQYVKAARKIPAPWFRYVVRTREHTVPCPKTEWNWYHCLPGPQWGRYGVESGAAWHRALENRYWLYDGLIGMCAFSMKLRSEDITHYFTVLNTHPVLDFLYNAYMGRLQYEFLDNRFYNSQWEAPREKEYFNPPDPVFGTETYDVYGKYLPWYKKK